MLVDAGSLVITNSVGDSLMSLKIIVRHLY